MNETPCVCFKLSSSRAKIRMLANLDAFGYQTVNFQVISQVLDWVLFLNGLEQDCALCLPGVQYCQALLLPGA